MGGEPTPVQELMALLARPGCGAALRALDAAGRLTQAIPELEAARACDQPGGIHFLPVLGHLIETATAADWLLSQLDGRPTATANLPAAVQRHPDLRFASAWAARYRERFAEPTAAGRTRAALFRLAALLHDIGKPATRADVPGGATFYDHQKVGARMAEAIGQRLGLSAAETGYVTAIVRAHMRPGQLGSGGMVTVRALRRFFRDTGDAGPDVLLVVLADHMATRGPHLDPGGWYAHLRWNDALLDAVWGEPEALARPLLTGHDLMAAFGLAPGPLIGRLLAQIGEAQAGGDIATREQALALAARLLQSTER